MYYHSQNLSREDKDNKLIHWRCWIGYKPQLTFYVSVPSSFWHIKLDLCENGWQEEAIGFSIACPLFYIAIGLNSKWPYNVLQSITKRKGREYTNGRDIGVSFHNGTLWVSLWNDPMESRREDPKWHNFNINFEDFIFGKTKSAKQVLEEREVEIPMPEKSYKGTAKLILYTWTRPRWFKKTMKRVEIDVPEGIPHEGKGENSWDCGKDATFGMTTGECESIAEGVGKLVGTCLNDRVKYGGYGDWNWNKQ